MNRPLNRVIVVDTKKEAVKFHPENAIILDKWTGDISDRTLWDLLPFLQSGLCILTANIILVRATQFSTNCTSDSSDSVSAISFGAME